MKIIFSVRILNVQFTICTSDFYFLMFRFERFGVGLHGEAKCTILSFAEKIYFGFEIFEGELYTFSMEYA